jgi:hypothetical protein
MIWKLAVGPTFGDPVEKYVMIDYVLKIELDIDQSDWALD